jgi:hypothetical protein
VLPAAFRQRLGKFVEENKTLLRNRAAETDAAVERLDQERFGGIRRRQDGAPTSLAPAEASAGQ